MTSFRFALVAVFLAAATVPVGVGSLSADERRTDVSEEVEARRVVREFFRTLNARRYDETCALLADGYFARRAAERRHCAIGLRVGFMWSQEIRWRIVGVSTEGAWVVVQTVADGAPGVLLLTRVGGRLHLLDMAER